MVSCDTRGSKKSNLPHFRFLLLEHLQYIYYTYLFKGEFKQRRKKAIDNQHVGIGVAAAGFDVFERAQNAAPLDGPRGVARPLPLAALIGCGE